MNPYILPSLIAIFAPFAAIILTIQFRHDKFDEEEDK